MSERIYISVLVSQEDIDSMRRMSGLLEELVSVTGRVRRLSGQGKYDPQLIARGDLLCRELAELKHKAADSLIDSVRVSVLLLDQFFSRRQA